MSNKTMRAITSKNPRKAGIVWNIKKAMGATKVTMVKATDDGMTVQGNCFKSGERIGYVEIDLIGGGITDLKTGEVYKK